MNYGGKGLIGSTSKTTNNDPFEAEKENLKLEYLKLKTSIHPEYKYLSEELNGYLQIKVIII